MSMSPTFNPGYTQPVDKLLGTAYPVVKVVYDNLIPIKYLAENIDAINTSILANRDAAAQSAIEADASAAAAELSAAEVATNTEASQAAAASAQEKANLAEASRMNAEDAETAAQSWAGLTGAPVSTGAYSAKEWALGNTTRGQAGGGSAKDWATYNGGLVDGVDGSAKAWATKTGAAVVTGQYAAKEWALGSATRGQAGGGSAKDWATYTGGTVDDTGYSAKKSAQDAAATLTTTQGVLTSTQAVLTNFRNIYYGPLGSDPTTRPDASAMVAGDEYFSTVSNTKKVYTGSAWIIPNVNATDLANATDPAKGSALVGHYNGSTVKAALDTLNNGTATSGGTLLDTDVFLMSRGAGALKQTLLALQSYVLAQVKQPGRVQGLKAANTPSSSSVTATVSKVVALNASGVAVIGTPGSLSCDLAIAGPAVGGRDQAGAFSNNVWVHYFYIYNPTTTTWGITCSLSQTAPTLPAGYTFFQYFGTFRKETAWLRDMRIYGATAFYNVPYGVVTNVTATTQTDISTQLQGTVPAVASRYSMHCYFYLTSDGSGVVSGQAYVAAATTDGNLTVGQMALNGLGANTQQVLTPVAQTLINTQALYYSMAVANGSAQKLSLEIDHFIVPNGDN